jgi:hypothetical protein
MTPSPHSDVVTGIKYYEMKSADLKAFLQGQKWWIEM